MRQQTDATIESTEKSLNGISRKLSDQEQKTAAQIREFLKQAREALTAGDVDGAHTLAVKAKVLLDELHP
jgi:ribosomal protein S20